MTYNCEEHGDYEGTPMMIGDRVLFDQRCPKCLETFLAEEEARNTTKAAREAKDRFESAMRRANIEPTYWEDSLDTFVRNTLELEKAYSAVTSLIDGKLKKIVMSGKNGTGKTHLACSAIKVLGGKIMSMYEISTTIRASYTAMAKETELDIVDALARLPLLVIDELGRTKGGDAEQNWLSYILDKRHVRKLPTILITNKHVKKDCETNGCQDCLENFIGMDVMSRVNEDGGILRFTGEDWRRKR